MTNILDKLKHFCYRQVPDARQMEPRFFMKIFRKDFVNTLRLDMVDFLAAQKIQEETFKSYKNCNAGKDLVIVAPGPTLNKYKPIPDALHLGLNRALFREDIHFDYLFMQDYIAVKDYINELGQERFKDTDKFFGIIRDYTYDGKATIPESVALRLGAKRYCIFNQWKSFESNFPTDIAFAPFATAASVAGSAIQFALYTNPKRIYLVGCDCSNVYFNENNKNAKTSNDVLKAWINCKKFAEIYYPETEIISVNPVGLKGLFKDIYME